MPKDHSKQGYRGIGFVTYAVPESVEKIMAVKHWLNGHEIAIDRATPKEEPSALKNMFARPPLGPNSRRSFDNGAWAVECGALFSVEVADGQAGGWASLREHAPEEDKLYCAHAGIGALAQG